MAKNDIDCDIIIVTFNGLNYTKKCVESIEKNTKDVNYRIIFVDNNSTDGTLEFLKEVPNSILISNDENFGFVNAMNQGFEKVSSKYTVWLNNDTVVTPNWLEILTEHLEKNPTAAAIGPVTNGSGVIQKENSWNEEMIVEEVSKFGSDFYKKNKGRIVEYHRIAGFCIVMKSELIKQIGKLDEQFNFGGYDDDDYCRRIRDAGFKILIAEDVFVYHKSGATFATSNNPDLKLSFLMQKGRRRLLKKWICHDQKKNNSSSERSPLVSIIMATRNREKLIPNAINSIIEQSYKNWELIVVNDGDSSLENIIENFSNPRIKYINLEMHKGKSSANNIAIKNSSGEFIAYLDDDDRWYPNHLEVTVRELLKNKSRSLVYTDYVQVDCIINEFGDQFPSKKTVMELKDVRGDTLNEMNIIPNFSLVHKKSLFDTAGNYDDGLDYYEDWDILKRFSKISHFIHVPEITGEYWVNQLRSERNAKALKDKNLENVVNYIKNKPDSILSQLMIDLDLADKLTKKHQLERALKIYKKILEIDLEYYPAIEGCADRLYNLRQFKEAFEYLEKMYKINPFRSQTYFLAANCLIYIKEYEKTKKMLEYALIISDDKSFYYLLQQCYKNLGNEKTSNFIQRKMSFTAENINFADVEEFLIKLYNKNMFSRKLLIFCYKFLKKFS